MNWMKKNVYIYIYNNEGVCEVYNMFTPPHPTHPMKVGQTPSRLSNMLTG